MAEESGTTRGATLRVEGRAKGCNAAGAATGARGAKAATCAVLAEAVLCAAADLVDRLAAKAAAAALGSSSAWLYSGVGWDIAVEAEDEEEVDGAGAVRGRRAGAVSNGAEPEPAGLATSALLEGPRAVLRLAAAGSFSSPNAGAGATGLTYSPCPNT